MPVAFADTLRALLNAKVGRTDGEVKPLSDAECDQLGADALADLWPDLGVLATGTVASDESSPIYTIPGSIERVSRIVLERTSSGKVEHVDKVSSWMYHSTTAVVIHPPIATNTEIALRFYGWKPFASNGSDLPESAMTALVYKAAAGYWGAVQGKLGNYENQMALDSGKIVTFQDATALSAYWQRLYEERVSKSPVRVSYAPRAASR